MSLQNECNIIYEKILVHFKKHLPIKYSELLKYGREVLYESDIDVSFPLCISYNEIVSNYSNINDDRILSSDDVLKIQFGIKRDNDSVIFCKTVGFDSNTITITNTLEKIQKKIVKFTKSSLQDKTTDDLRILIETECLKYNIFPILLNVFYERENLDSTFETKYVALNYRKLYNDEEFLIQENNCFQIDQGDIFDVELIVTELKHSEESIDSFAELETNYIGKITENVYNLKLQNARKVYSNIKKLHGNNAFLLEKYNTAKERFGLKECFDNNVIEILPTKYNKNGIKTFTKNFTLEFA